MQTYHANGKLLITGEYAVLDGALALAIPCKYGQQLDVESNDIGIVDWKSLDHENKIWFEAKFNLGFEILNTSNQEMAERLQTILKECKIQNQNFLLKGANFTTTLDFPRQWGLGTSSTLVSLIAQFANINPFDLYFKTFGGSGYDIACATINTPILYQLKNKKPLVEKVHFAPDFIDNLYFIYLDKKQNSRDGINHYRKKNTYNQELIAKVSTLTRQLLVSQNLKEFSKILDEHESIVSNFLNFPQVKTLHFDDFQGSIKSLGAWGGDFVLAISSVKRSKIYDYFEKKGFKTIIPYGEMMKK